MHLFVFFVMKQTLKNRKKLCNVKYIKKTCNLSFLTRVGGGGAGDVGTTSLRICNS
jgi:hypothetical protein